MKDRRIWWKILHTCTASLTPFTRPFDSQDGKRPQWTCHGKTCHDSICVCGRRTISRGLSRSVTEGNDLSTRNKTWVEIRSWFQCVGHLQILTKPNNHEEKKLGQPVSWPSCIPCIRDSFRRPFQSHWNVNWQVLSIRTLLNNKNDLKILPMSGLGTCTWIFRIL